jgi:hypothetical protein
VLPPPPDETTVVATGVVGEIEVIVDQRLTSPEN